MSELIPYTPTTLDSLPEERQHSGGSGAKILILGGKKPSYPGLKRVNFRLVAPSVGQRIFSAYKHIFEVMPGTGRYVFAYCPLKMRVAAGFAAGDQSCYFCERGAQVAASGAASDLALAKRMEADEVVLVQGVARNDMAKGVQIYEGKWHLLKKIRGWLEQWGSQFDPFAWQMASDLTLVPPDSQVNGSRFEYELAPYQTPLVALSGQNTPDVEACAALIKEAVCMREWAFSQVLSYQKQKELYESKMSFAPSSSGPPTNAAPPTYQQPPQYGAPPQMYGQPPQQPQYGNAPPGYQQQPQYQPHHAQQPVQTFTAGPPPVAPPQQNTALRKPVF